MDYRKLPTEQLNSNIPKGRDMIKWAPFRTMPEQFENVDKIIKNQEKIKRPILSDDRLQELQYTLETAMNENKAIRVSYFYDGGRFFIDLEVIKIDQWSMLLIGQKFRSDDFVFVSFLDILDIDFL